ncbi:MAG TPA: PaaI family thioesterase [Caldisericia bacterium]|nr:PaaI family thioesterase [Caldisericia bacterium]HPF49217.1 PaaI family thioesterase [Caldisericia bacterium]HPI84103.1 PaaI family thioesterase [Caldisericia bacterium]HPQ93361.1 PaaI family thioesterase [Caldisericia bacterium]HRV75257.1 PaaI family thioesterase [Caldisericia bacterium]
MEDKDSYYGTESNCFACGIRNENGLKLRFKTLENCVEALYLMTDQFEGWDGVIHGGIISTMLDEAMSHAVFRLLGETVVTAEMNVRFVKPLRVGHHVKLVGRVESQKGRVINTSAEIVDLDDGGVVVARATGRFVKVPIEQEFRYV